MRLSKIVLLVAVVAAVVVLVAVFRPHSTSTESPASDKQVSAPATASAGRASPSLIQSPTPTASSSTTSPAYVGSDDARRRAAPVIVAFARAYPRTAGGRRAWLSDLTPYATTEVVAGLRKVDLDAIPEGHYEGYEILRYDGGQVAAEVSYREGWALVLYVSVSPTTEPFVAAYDHLVE